MGHDQTVDQELVQMVSEGDSTALETLYDRYAGAVYSISYRILRDAGDAEEAMQDTFVSLWRRAHTYEPDQGKVYAWLLGIARNRSIDGLRRRSSAGRNIPRANTSTAGEMREIPSTSDNGAEAAWMSELRDIVKNAIGGLPDEQRRVIEMSYLEGLSQREISEKTGIPLGTVKTRNRLAIKKLKNVLEPVIGRTVDLDGLQ